MNEFQTTPNSKRDLHICSTFLEKWIKHNMQRASGKTLLMALIQAYSLSIAKMFGSSWSSNNLFDVKRAY
ncbi:hypothetical protein LguiA_032344 [Lonicera macranthoides]